MSRQIRPDQKYRDKVLKMIPSDVVAAYLVIAPLAADVSFGDGDPSPVIPWVIFGVMLAITPLYLRFVQKVTCVKQLVLTSVAFAIWVYSLGGPFEGAGIYSSALASIILTLWTLLIPVLGRPGT